MNIRSFKTTSRFYARHMNFTILNIAGLALSMAVFILIILYVRFEFDFDSFHVNKDRIYRIEHLMKEGVTPEKMVGCPAPLGPALLTEFPEVEEMTRVFVTRKFRRFEVKTGNDESFLLDPLYVDQAFIDIFSFELLRSMREEPFNTPFSIILTEKTAKLLFGNIDPLGETIENDGTIYTVSGIIDDVPENSHLEFNALCSMNTFDALDPEDDPYSWNDNWLSVYVLLKENVDYRQMEGKLLHLLRKLWKKDTDNELYIRPMADIHLRSDISGDYAVKGDIRNIIVLILIAITVVTMAGVNYTNLSVVQSVKNAKNAALRKIIGASGTTLSRQLLTESTMITLLAMVLGFFVAAVIMPYFNSIVNRDLSLQALFDPSFIMIIILVSLLVGIIAGIYPAFLIYNFNALNIIRGNIFLKGNTRLPQKLLMSFQFLISVALIISTIGIIRQVRYLKNMDLGYDDSNMIRVEVKDTAWNRIDLFRETILKNPGILKATAHDYPVNNSTDWCRIGWDGSNEGEYVPIGVNYVDNNFIQTYKLNILNGEGFRSIPSGLPGDNNLVILNESAVKRLGLKDPVGKNIYYGSDYRGRLEGRRATIIGIVQDFHYLSAHDEISPFMLRLLNYKQPPVSISIKVAKGKDEEIVEYLNNIFSQIFPEQVFNYHFVDDYYSGMYPEETKMSKVVMSMSLLAIFISCLGVFGLVSFSTSMRKKEVGIRKVLGARISDIVWIFSKEFCVLLFLAYIISIPVSYIVIIKWMETFPYRVKFSASPFILSIMLVSVVTLATILAGTAKVAGLNPAESSKSD